MWDHDECARHPHAPEPGFLGNLLPPLLNPLTPNIQYCHYTVYDIGSILYKGGAGWFNLGGGDQRVGTPKQKLGSRFVSARPGFQGFSNSDKRSKIKIGLGFRV